MHRGGLRCANPPYCATLDRDAQGAPWEAVKLLWRQPLATPWSSPRNPRDGEILSVELEHRELLVAPALLRKARHFAAGVSA